MAKLPDATILDFESLPIRARPRFPPAPVGLAVRRPGERRSRYLAWGHIGGGNTHSFADAQREVAEAYARGPVVFHHANFDTTVARKRLGLPTPAWDRIDDTQPMLFLDNPHAPSYHLKDAAERYLGDPPVERDAVVDWLVEHQPVPGLRLSRSRDSEAYAGAFVAYAPVKLVGAYACGDTDRTHDLRRVLLPKIQARGMGEAYDRERRLLPVIQEMEDNGVRVDVRRLTRDIEEGEATLRRLDGWLRKRLRAPGLDLNKPQELGKALVQAGAAVLGRTPKSTDERWQYEVNKDALYEGVHDKTVLHVLLYRAKLTTALRTFMRPWLVTALANNGYIFTTWNTTRRDKGRGFAGARTGRLTATPNFQNLMNVGAPLFRHLEPDPVEAAKLPRAPFDLPPLPAVRTYILPHQEGEWLIDRDHSQQELRIMGHYEGGSLMALYLNDPWLDLHAYAQVKINELLHANWSRKPIKNTVLGFAYGEGVGLLAVKNRTTVELATKLKKTLAGLFPGLPDLYREMRRRGEAGEPIRTWGGREYYCEPPRFIDNRLVKFDYKLVNALIQASAADLIKQVLIEFHAAKDRRTKILLSAHDENLGSTLPHLVRSEMEVLRVCMERQRFDVPMLSQGDVSDKSWGQLRPYDRKGKQVFRGRLAA